MSHGSFINEGVVNKWTPFIDQKKFNPIERPGVFNARARRAVTAQLLENMSRDLQGSRPFLSEAAPATSIGNNPSGVVGSNPGAVATWDPILLQMVRRTAPNLIAYDICGVQPMQGPTSLVFAKRTMYGNQNGEEALFNRANTTFSGNASLPVGADVNGQSVDVPAGATAAPAAGAGNLYSGYGGLVTGTQPATTAGTAGVGAILPGATGNQAWESNGTSWVATGLIYQNPNPAAGDFAGTSDPFESTSAAVGRGLSTAAAERLSRGGAGDGAFNQMAFRIDRISVTARSRALAAHYSQELAQDLRAVHNLDAESEFVADLTNEILAEVNREVVETIYRVARLGAPNTATPGIFDMNVDSNGRWSGEKYLGLLTHTLFEANSIAKTTRMGRGNFVICSSNAATALLSAGTINNVPNTVASLTVDDTGNTFAGTIHNGQMRVYIDPYFEGPNGQEIVCVGYRGASEADAGLFYCPYVPLQMYRALGENSFDPRIGFKMRYGLVANPFVLDASGVPDGERLTFRRNQYYRVIRVDNLST